jgi:hypothetical protein
MSGLTGDFELVGTAEGRKSGNGLVVGLLDRWGLTCCRRLHQRCGVSLLSTLSLWAIIPLVSYSLLLDCFPVKTMVTIHSSQGRAY